MHSDGNRPTDAAEGPAWGAGWRILLLWCAGLGAAGQFAKIAVILPALSQVYPDRPAALGFLVSLISLTGVVFGLAAGSAVARLGARRLLLAALWFGAALSAFQALLPPLPVMLASRLVEGGAHLAIVVAAPTLIAALTPGRGRGAALTLWSTFFGVAFALAAWTLPGLVAAHGAAAAFHAHAIWMAVCAAALGFALPRAIAPVPIALDPANSAPTEPPAPPQDTTAAAPGRTGIARHAAVYRLEPAAAPALGWLFYTLAFVALLTVLPGRLPPGQGQLAATWMPLAGIAVSLLIGVPLLRWLDAGQVVMAGFALALILTGWLAIAPDRAAPAVAIFAVLGLVQGASFAAVPQVNPTPAGRARANGAIAQTGNVGNLLGTPLMLAVTGVAGHAGMVTLAALAFAAGLAVHLACAWPRAVGKHR